MADISEAAPTGAASQTLSRGLETLELLAEAAQPLSISQLAAALGVHRSNAYRILRTLEHHRFVVRDAAGMIRLSPKLTVLARSVAPILHTAALPVIKDLAHNLGMTAFLTMLDRDEVVTLITAEPDNVAANISRNPGVRHSITRGAPGHALEAALSSAERSAALGSPVFSPAAKTAKQQGFATSVNEVIAGVAGVAVPLRIPGEAPAAVAIVHFHLPDNLSAVVDALKEGARQIKHNYQ